MPAGCPATIRPYSPELQVGKLPNYPFSTVNSSVKYRSLLLFSGLWKMSSSGNCFLEVTSERSARALGFVPCFPSCRRLVLLCCPLPGLELPFGAAVFRDAHTWLSQGFRSEDALLVPVLWGQK